MTDVTLTRAELLGVVLFATTLAVTDGAALGKCISVKPATVTAYNDATDDDRLGLQDLIEQAGISANSNDRRYRELEAIGLVERDDDGAWMATLIPEWAPAILEEYDVDFRTAGDVDSELAVDVEAVIQDTVNKFAYELAECEDPYSEFPDALDLLAWADGPPGHRWRPRGARAVSIPPPPAHLL